MKKKYKMEELITNKLYNQANTLFLYQSNKVMNLDLEMGSDTSQTIDIQNFTKITKNMEFAFIIMEKHQEKDEVKGIIKNYFTGYLSLLNLTINNGTDDLNIVNDEELYKSINEINIEQEVNYDLIDSSELLDSSSLIDSSDKVDNFRTLEENEIDSKNISFIKINFYENGKIKDIFTPNDFYEENMPIFEEIMKLIIPKLSKELYSDNITDKVDKVNQLLNSSEEMEEEEINSDLIDINEINDEQKFSDNFEIEDMVNLNQRRRISEKEKSYEIIDSTNLYEYENIEADMEYSELSNDDDSHHLKGFEENETFSNITEFDVDNVGSMQAKLDGSQIKKLKNSFINKKGIIVSIFEFEDVVIYQPETDSLSDLNEEEAKIKSEIYNEDNEIQRNDTEVASFSGQDFSFNISKISMENSNNISLINTIDNKAFIQKLYRYYNNFTLTKYNSTENTDLNLRFLKYKDELQSDFTQNNVIKDSKLEIEHTILSKKNHRHLQISSNSYYGLKNFEKEKIIFKYNLIGLILEGVVVSKITVSTGVTDNYFKLTLGFINYKTKFSSVQTNLHVIIKNSHQMTYNFLSLLSKSNEDLIERNKIYLNIIIDLEKNVSKLLENYYDYSGLFREHL